jgi:hypothetical protein
MNIFSRISTISILTASLLGVLGTTSAQGQMSTGSGNYYSCYRNLIEEAIKVHGYVLINHPELKDNEKFESFISLNLQRYFISRFEVHNSNVATPVWYKFSPRKGRSSFLNISQSALIDLFDSWYFGGGSPYYYSAELKKVYKKQGLPPACNGLISMDDQL